jgi:hypothetical protein
MITTWIRRVVLVHLNSSTLFSSPPLSAPRYRRFHPREPMAEKGNGPSAHPSHKLAYVFSASHGHEHPATIQWSLLYARDQVHKCFACCRAWRFSQKAQPGLDSGRSSLACDSFSCGEGRYCHVVLARYQLVLESQQSRLDHTRWRLHAPANLLRGFADQSPVLAKHVSRFRWKRESDIQARIDSCISSKSLLTNWNLGTSSSSFGCLYRPCAATRDCCIIPEPQVAWSWRVLDPLPITSAK